MGRFPERAFYLFRENTFYCLRKIFEKKKKKRKRKEKKKKWVSYDFSNYVIIKTRAQLVKANDVVS